MRITLFGPKPAGIILCLLIFTACGNRSTQSDKSMNQKITVTGTAENLKAGAVVMTETGDYFIEGLDSWPDHLHKKQVEVTGILSEAQIMPVAEQDSSGAWSQGTEGPQTDRILKEASYKLSE